MKRQIRLIFKVSICIFVIYLLDCAVYADTKTYYDTLAYTDDYNDYTIYVNYSGNISISLTNIPTGCDYDLYLYDAYWNEVSYSENWGTTNENITYYVSPTETETYYVEVYSYSGGSASPYKLTITYPYDTDGPSTPSNLSVTDPNKDGVSLRLTWTGSTDSESGVAYYRLWEATDSNFTQNVYYYETTATNCEAYGLTAGTIYYYRVEALDKTGNRSKYSNVVSKAPVDAIKPTVTITNVSYSGTFIDADETVTVYYSISDASNRMNVVRKIRNERWNEPAQKWELIKEETLSPLYNQPNGNYPFSYTLSRNTHFITDHLYISVEATDASNNSR